MCLLYQQLMLNQLILSDGSIDDALLDADKAIAQSLLDETAWGAGYGFSKQCILDFYHHV